jgi:glutamate racemase
LVDALQLMSRSEVHGAKKYGPIGVFDSGVGGLSVLRDMRRLLPNQDVLYAADTAFCPYGTRPANEILERTLTIAHALYERGVALLVVACNTACAVALNELRSQLPIPIVGLEPAVKPAVAMSSSARIGVLATPRTVASERFARLVATHAGSVVVEPIPAPGLVELVEQGVVTGERARQALTPLIIPALERGCDVFVLGCTHYPFLRDAIIEITGPGIPILDSGLAVARRTRFLLEGETPGDEWNQLTEQRGVCQLLTTGDPAQIGPLASLLTGDAFAVERLAV